MPKVYSVTITREANFTVIAPDGMTTSEVRRLAARKSYDMMQDAEEDVDVYPGASLSVQDAADRGDGDDGYRVNDDRDGLVCCEEVDWIEGVIRRREEGGEDEETVRVSKDQVPLFAPVPS